MGSKSRRKGSSGEREWCDYLRQNGFEAKRLLGQARDSGADVAVPPVLYEVKRYHKIAVRKFLDQVVRAMATDNRACTIPVVAMREDGRADWMVMLRAEDFMQLIKNAHINDLLK